MKQKTLDELWKEFSECGSGFTLEADRDYKRKSKPLWYNLRMYGLHYKKGYEITGSNLKELLQMAVRDCEKSMKLMKKKYGNIQNT